MKKQTNRDWFPRNRPQQLVMFTNVRAKIEGYKNILPLDLAKVAQIELICDTFIAVFNFVEQTRAKAENLTDYQDLIFMAKDGVQGEPAPAPPAFQVLVLPVGAFVGIFEKFRDLVAEIKTADNYTHGIGEDLMIVITEGGETSIDNITASIKPTSLMNNYKVRIEGSMQGFKGMKIEYRPKGVNVPQTFFLTKLPAEITVVPQQTGEPESGELRAIMIEDNQEAGNWSPNYPVTVS